MQSFNMILLRKSLKLWFGILILLLPVHMLQGQSRWQSAEKQMRERNYLESISLWRQTIDYYKKIDERDSIFLAYEELQYCYTNRFKLDSACIIFKEASEYALKVNAYKSYIDFQMAIAEIKYMAGEKDSSEILFMKILDDSKVQDYHKIRVYYRLSNFAKNKSEADISYSYITKALDLALKHKDSSILGAVYSTYGSIESIFGSKEKALDIYLKSIPFLENENKTMIIGNNYRLIAGLFLDLNNIVKSEEYALNAMRVADQFNYNRERAYCQSLLGQIALKKDDYSSAIQFFNDCIQYFKTKKINDELFYSYTNLAFSYLYSNQLDKAQKEITNAAQYADKFNNSFFNYQYYYTKAYVEFHSNKPSAMLNSIQNCERISATVDNSNFARRIIQLKSMYYQLMGDYKKALETNEQYHSLKDSLYQIEQSRIIHEMEAKFQKYEQDKEINILSKENEYKETLLSQQKILIIGGAMAILIFGFLSLFIYKLYEKVSHQNELINQSLETKDTLLREIHHRVKNNLQIISSLLALQSKYIKDKEALDALQQGQDRVQTMALIHQDLYETEHLGGVNTSNYIHNLVDKIFDSYRQDEDDIQVIVDIDELILDLDTMIPLGLIINELVNNSINHAFKTDNENAKINISLKENNNELHLIVSDNGSGVNDLSEINGKSFGLELVKAFTKKLKAQMLVTNEAGLQFELLINNYKKFA